MIPLADIVCCEAGSSGQSPWCAPIGHLGGDLEAIERLARERVIDLAVKGNVAVIEGKDRVGIVILPSGRRLVIRTKIPCVTILEWLVYLGEFPWLEAWLQEAGIGSGDEFHIAIGKLFLREMERITRCHLRKDYMAEVSEGSLARGRVLVSRLAYRVHRLPRLPLAHRCRTLDTPYNSLLALALDRLRLFFSGFSHDDRSTLARLHDQWACIRRNDNDPVTAATEAQWASPPGYRDAIQIARLIVLGLAMDPDSSIGGQAFTLSLALIWERSLRKMFFDIKEQTGWSPVPDDERTKQWDDSYGAKDPSRWLTADVMLERNLDRWVLDAKYKRAYGCESREDRFQMCAYAVAFNADRATLVYPTASHGKSATRTLLATSIGTKNVIIDSVDLPMCSGPQACMDALIQLCKPEAGYRFAGPVQVKVAT